jgi:hypothetical protein
MTTMTETTTTPVLRVLSVTATTPATPTVPVLPEGKATSFAALRRQAALKEWAESSRKKV